LAEIQLARPRGDSEWPGACGPHWIVAWQHSDLRSGGEFAARSEPAAKDHGAIVWSWPGDRRQRACRPRLLCAVAGWVLHLRGRAVSAVRL